MDLIGVDSPEVWRLKSRGLVNIVTLSMVVSECLFEVRTVRTGVFILLRDNGCLNSGLKNVLTNSRTY